MLGIGVSHAPSVEMRGGDYGNPLEQMRRLPRRDGRGSVRRALADRPGPARPRRARPEDARAGRRASGRRPSLFRARRAHRAIAREHLGAEPALITEVTAVLTTDRSAGLAIARAFARNYLALPNYANNLLRLGWTDDDIAGDGSERADRRGHRHR